MKNYDEFRKTVFDKAKKYEAQRKARNKKIIESVSLCSLVIVITLSAYLGILHMPAELPEDTTQTTVTDTTASQISDMTTQTETTNSMFVETTTEQSYTTIATTAETTVQTTTESTEESTEIPSISKLEFRGTAKDPHFNIGETSLLKIETFEEWTAFCEENNNHYPNLHNSVEDAEYFEEHLLVIVQYAGYDIIAFEHHFLPDTNEDESYILQITLRKNPKNRREQIHVMSIEKDNFQDAEIRILEN